MKVANINVWKIKDWKMRFGKMKVEVMKVGNIKVGKIKDCVIFKVLVTKLTSPASPRVEEAAKIDTELEQLNEISS